jgi:hypothetical protein
MSVAIMQPYIFPYLGYFQLVNAVDDFVFYDDVNFIKQGWINRNNILINNTKTLFTIPIKKASSFTEIKDTEIHPQLYNKWKIKFLKSISQAYAKAPYFNEVYALVESVLKIETNIGELAGNSVIIFAEYLELKQNFHWSSIDFSDSKKLDRADRLISICNQLNAHSYINVIGGKNLYDKGYFKKSGLELKFLSPKLVEYNQNIKEFVSGLSIIDILMFNSVSQTRDFLNKYELV